MTVFEMFDTKYRDMLKTMHDIDWENFKVSAEAKKCHISEYMYMCIEITDKDIKNSGGYSSELYKEISYMYESKMLASNKHRNTSEMTKYWLTKKGFRYLNKNKDIC